MIPSPDGVEIGESKTRSSPLPTEELEVALAAVKEQVEATEKQVAILNEALARARKEQHLLEGLISLRHHEEPTDDRPLLPGSSVLSDVRVSPGRGEVADAAVLLLRDHGEPMHIGELMSVLKDQNVKLPGQGTQANLISRISRDERIARTARGVYALREWGLAEMPASKRSRQSKQKGPKAKS